MDRNKLDHLLRQRALRPLSEEELADIGQWLGNSDLAIEAVVQLMEDKMALQAAQLTENRTALQATPLEADRKQALFQQIVSSDHVKSAPRLLHVFRWAAAAVLLIAVGAGIFYALKPPAPVTSAMKPDVAPGHTGAVLTLADGSQMVLDSLGNGVVATQGGAVVKMVDGQLVYEAGTGALVYNTMSTPRGRQFQLKLPDGTTVWLNAESSIRYPTMFAKERKVEVTGEAYFEVAKASIPFIVQSGNRVEVTVLGTHFNLNAYDNEPFISTTLAEGAIRVASPKIKPLLLKPGQQAQLKPGASLQLIEAVDVSKVIAWKNGVFNFDKVPFAEAMRQLERWYDIDVVYQDGVPEDIELVGEITKGVTLNNLTMALKKIGVKCHLKGRKLIIQTK